MTCREFAVTACFGQRTVELCLLKKKNTAALDVSFSNNWSEQIEPRNSQSTQSLPSTDLHIWAMLNQSSFVKIVRVNSSVTECVGNYSFKFSRTTWMLPLQSFNVVDNFLMFAKLRKETWIKTTELTRYEFQCSAGLNFCLDSQYFDHSIMKTRWNHAGRRALTQLHNSKGLLSLQYGRKIKGNLVEQLKTEFQRRISF